MQTLKGTCASPGLAAGTAAVLTRAASRRVPSGDARTESAALRNALVQAIARLKDMISVMTDGSDARDMLEFQIAMLEDEALAEPALAGIEDGRSADAAWMEAMEAEIRAYEASADEHFRARASDLVDIRDRVLDVLTGVAAAEMTPGAILLADDITPSLFLENDWTERAIILRKGSTTSHVAMLARARGVPMIVNLQGAGTADFRRIDGRAMLVNADDGVAFVDPDEIETARFAALRKWRAGGEARMAAFLGGPAVTLDGTPITMLVNIADPAELHGLDPAHCDGIGLVRTELLFEGKALPDEETQTSVYSRIVDWAQGRPVTFRTLDAGGDKPIIGLTPVDESNPFLGVRGVRLMLQRPDVFVPQLKALARAAAVGDVEIMLPMVSIPEELEAARAMLDTACAELASEGAVWRRPALGMMVEVPAAALTLDLFDAAFFSIGTNDLTQYVMAAGRDMAGVAALADPAHDAVLRMIAMVTAHGRKTGLKVSLCGDAGGDPRMIPLLLARGVSVLSMSPRLLAGAKQAISALDLGGAR